MQGFDDAGPAISEEETPALLEDFERWLTRRDPVQPFFFFLLTRDAHVTYQPAYDSYRRFAAAPVPEDEYADFLFELMQTLKEARSRGAEVPEEQQRQWIDLYDGELAQLDAALAELPGILERTGRGGETILVVSADHGEHFFDPHGSISHGGPGTPRRAHAVRLGRHKLEQRPDGSLVLYDLERDPLRELSPQVLEQLRELGYVDDVEEER